MIAFLIPTDEALERLFDIYSRIPTISCKHCSSCCGPILWFEPEEICIQAYMKKESIRYVQWSNQEFERNNMRCPYLSKNRCIIYPVRPLVCRLQGVTKGLTCQQTLRPLIDDDEIVLIKKMFFRLLSDMDASHLVYGTREMVNQLNNHISIDTS